MSDGGNRLFFIQGDRVRAIIRRKHGRLRASDASSTAPTGPIERESALWSARSFMNSPALPRTFTVVAYTGVPPPETSENAFARGDRARATAFGPRGHEDARVRVDDASWRARRCAARAIRTHRAEAAAWAGLPPRPRPPGSRAPRRPRAQARSRRRCAERVIEALSFRRIGDQRHQRLDAGGRRGLADQRCRAASRLPSPARPAAGHATMAAGYRPTRRTACSRTGLPRSTFRDAARASAARIASGPEDQGPSAERQGPSEQGLSRMRASVRCSPPAFISARMTNTA